MKKIFVLMFSFVFAFSFWGCTVQANVSPDLFLARFVESFSDFIPETDSMFYEEGKCVVFVNSASSERYALEMTVDSGERIQKISLACVDADKAEEFFSFAEKITAVYAPDEDFKAVTEKLFDGKQFAYYESQWYYYTFSDTETGLFFSIKNKKLSPEKDAGLTLRENDIVTDAR